MKRFTIYAATLILPTLLFSCNQEEKLPPEINSVETARKLITNKTWEVIDVATISGSQESFFDDDKSKIEKITAPTAESLNWLSKIDGIEKGNDFNTSTYNDNMKISLAFNKDSVATATGMEGKRQIFDINNKNEENKPKGLKLTLYGESKAFESMGVSSITSTYYILGANENRLLLLTPNRLNGLKVVLLLKVK